MKGNKSNNLIHLSFTLLFVTFITILSRTPTLSRVTHLVPLWSYISLLSGKWSYARQILLNIALFIPLGYFLRSIIQSRWAILVALFTSISIELIQYLTYRGMLDCDDLISNVLGTAIGILMWRMLEKHDDGLKRGAKAVMLTAGLVGCLMVAVPVAKNTISSAITNQFWFSLSSISTVADGEGAEEWALHGTCFTYDRPTPSYKLLLGDEELRTEIDGEYFFAVVNNAEEKEELRIRFSGYQPMPTGIWIRPDRGIEYVAGDEEEPEGIPETAILKAYSAEFDTFLFEDGNKLVWLIGWDELDSSTEIIYHLHTNEPEKLPERRVQYKFDNRGFRVGTDKEIESIGHYRVFEDIIPTDYNVTAIVVGFNTEGTITWTESFRPTY